MLVPGEAVGKGRPRVTVRGGRAMMYTPDKTAKFEALVRLEAAQSMRGRPLIKGPVRLGLEIVMGVPDSYPKKRRADCLEGREFPTKKPDIDNVVKAFADAFNGIVWEDDVQIVDLHAVRRYGEFAHVGVTVSPVLPALAVEPQAGLALQ